MHCEVGRGDNCIHYRWKAFTLLLSRVFDISRGLQKILLQFTDSESRSWKMTLIAGHNL